MYITYAVHADENEMSRVVGVFKRHGAHVMSL